MINDQLHSKVLVEWAVSIVIIRPNKVCRTKVSSLMIISNNHCFDNMAHG